MRDYERDYFRAALEGRLGHPVRIQWPFDPRILL